MQERSATVIAALVLLLLIFALGFLVHVSARFPGSFTGSVIGAAGAILILVALSYAPLKRVPLLHDRLKRHVSERTLLTIHVYAGVLGPFLGLIHAAHKLESPLGVSLTGIMMLVVISGYIGRYLLLQLSLAVRGRKSQLAMLKTELATLTAGQNKVTATAPETVQFNARLGRLSLIFATAEKPMDRVDSPPAATDLASAIADTEYAIRAENATKGLFDASLTLHGILGAILLALLAVHIWSGFYYGLRWL
ncbi:MAG: hypothetical protein AB7O49_04335 [Sphingomonadales bacterium]